MTYGLRMLSFTVNLDARSGEGDKIRTKWAPEKPIVAWIFKVIVYDRGFLIILSGWYKDVGLSYVKNNLEKFARRV